MPSVATAGSFSLDNGVQSTDGFEAASQGGSDTDAPAAADSADDGRGAMSSFGGFSAGALAGFGAGFGRPSAETAGSFSTGNGVQPSGGFVSASPTGSAGGFGPGGGTPSVQAPGHFYVEDGFYIEDGVPAATDDTTVDHRVTHLERLTLNDPDSDGGVKPVLVDLDGDGLEIAAADENFVLFDTDDTGLIHRTAWAGKGDGVLFFDADGDGTISAAREYIFTEWDTTAGGDMEALPSRRHPGTRRRAKRDGAYPGSMPRRSPEAGTAQTRHRSFSIVSPGGIRRGMETRFVVLHSARTSLRDG